MKKETLLEIVLGSVGGIVFSLGMCMCLIPKWNMFTAGVIMIIVGILILIPIITIYKKTHPKKKHKKINRTLLVTWIVGITGTLVMGFGMSKVLVNEPSSTDLIIGMIFGILGLLTCILNYPIYSYLKNNK